jgi:formylmethanofuran dehydrogenase subunit C
MLTLTYTGTTTIPLEAECVTPDNLAGKATDEIARLPVHIAKVSFCIGAEMIRRRSLRTL